MGQRNQGILSSQHAEVSAFYAQQAQQHAEMAHQHATAAQLHAEEAAGHLSEHEIQEGIQGMLDTVPVTKPYHLKVQVEHGVATLTGTANNKEVKKTAAHIAWRYPGVKDVHDTISLQQ